MAPFIVACMFFTLKTPLGGCAGLSEEYVINGWNQFHTGTHSYHFVSTSIPNLFRPPGYSYFIAKVIALTNPGMKPDPSQVIILSGSRFYYPSETTFNNVESVCKKVYFIQAILLGLSGVFICAALFPFLGSKVSTLLSLSFSLNPLLILLTGMEHYEILNLFALIIATIVLGYSLRTRNRFTMLISGCLFGISTLIRPLTLILPFPLLIISWFMYRNDGKSFLIQNTFFVLGFLVVITPWTLRNYEISGRFIPVNAQSGIAFWSSSAVPLSLESNVYHWTNLFEGEMKDVYVKYVGPDYNSLEDYVSRVLKIENVYKKEFIKNLGNQPYVYLGNIIRNGFLYSTGINSIKLDAFSYIQNKENILTLDHFIKGDSNLSGGFCLSRFYYVEIFILSIVGMIGLCLSLFYKTPFGQGSLIVYICLLLAHSISYMDLMYYYSKIPFLYIGVGVLIFYLDSCLMQNRIMKHLVRLGIPSLLVIANLVVLAFLFI